MKTKITVIFILFFVFTLFNNNINKSYAAKQINWLNYDEGILKGKKQGKKIFLNFYANWCTYCLLMFKTTYEDKNIIAYLNKNFIPIKVNTEKQRRVASDYGVTGLPSTWFLTDNGKKINNLPGYIDSERLLYILKYINTDSYKKMTFTDFKNRIKK